jgi:SAM-dependent methyltransferase
MNGTIEHFRGYPIKRRLIEVAGREFAVLGPANFESLVDEPAVIARFERDEYMPYWAEFWPASLLLADSVAQWIPAADRDKPLQVLDLGCGLGIISLVLLSLGYRVIASDYDEDALAFVVESARRNGLPPPETRSVDWRAVYPDLLVDRIVAAEVLYESRNLRPVAEFVQRHLLPDGAAIICDANRTTADAFDGIARHCGLSVEVHAAERSSGDGENIVRGRVFVLRHKAAEHRE